tara:strand:- start:1628 stop:1930 length:303 start_codon:yes stop_codon:yes gene_type:complete
MKIEEERKASLTEPLITTMAVKNYIVNGAKYTGFITVEGTIVTMHRKGELSYPDGTSFRGDFDNGVMHGRGTSKYSDKSIYYGEWRDGAKGMERELTFCQ